MYIKVENNIPLHEVVKPDWYFSKDGKPVSDEWLAENENIYLAIDGPDKPVVEPNHEKYEYVELNSVDKWVINKNKKVIFKTYTKVTYSLDEFKKLYFDDLKRMRQDYENSGMIFNTSDGRSLKIQTDRESRANLFSTYVAVKNGIREDNSLWKTIDGFESISNNDIERLSSEVLGYVQQCFNNEKVLYDKIDKTDNHDSLLRVSLEINWPATSLFKKED